jgi:hypothetical protein
MTPPNLGDEQPHSGGASCTRRGKLQPMRFLGTVARDETSPIRKSIRISTDSCVDRPLSLASARADR